MTGPFIPANRWLRSRWPVLVPVVVGLGLFLVIHRVGAGTWAFAKPVGLVVAPLDVPGAAAKVGQEAMVAFSIHNGNSMPIRIIGVERSCSCVSTSDLPVTSQPGETKKLDFTWHIEHSTPDGLYTQHVRLMTDVAGMSSSIAVQARIEPASR